MRASSRSSRSTSRRSKAKPLAVCQRRILEDLLMIVRAMIQVIQRIFLLLGTRLACPLGVYTCCGIGAREKANKQRLALNLAQPVPHFLEEAFGDVVRKDDLAIGFIFRHGGVGLVDSQAKKKERAWRRKKRATPRRCSTMQKSSSHFLPQASITARAINSPTAALPLTFFCDPAPPFRYRPISSTAIPPTSSHLAGTSASFRVESRASVRRASSFLTLITRKRDAS